MVARQRRRKAARAAELIGLGLILAAGALAGYQALSGSPAPDEVEAGAGAAAASGKGAPPPPPPAPRNELDPDLQRAVERVVHQAVDRAVSSKPDRVSRSAVTVAVHVRELGVAGELVALGADEPMLPASNMKLVTSAAALLLLGADGQFETRFEADAPVVDGVLQGDLVVRAGGDPLYTREPGDGAVRHRLLPVARELEALGIRAIAGRVVLDEGTYEAPAPGPGWPSDNQHWQAYCALSGGFSANAGCLTATVEPGAPGGPAKVRVLPRDHGLTPALSVRTGARKSALRIAVEARRGTCVVRGSMPLDVPQWSTSFSHPDPVELFGEVLLGALREAGISVQGGVVRDRGRDTGRVLAVLRSPIVDTLVPINTDSNNSVADQVYFTLGARVAGEGTRAGGRRATAEAFRRLGLSEQGLVQVDGSGLSRDNRVTARQISGLLTAVMELDADTARRYEGSLALGGVSGTLEDRMSAPPLHGNVRAKTGWISGASSLSGLVTARDGRRYVFSILVGYPRVGGLNTSCWKPMQEEVCELLCRYEPISEDPISEDPVSAEPSGAGTVRGSDRPSAAQAPAGVGGTAGTGARRD